MKRWTPRKLKLPPYQGQVAANYDTPLFLESISDCRKILDNPKTKILLDKRNRVGLGLIPLEPGKHTEVVVKEFFSGGLNRLKSLFLPSKARRAWRAAGALVEKGVDTPFPVAFLERRRKGAITESYYISEWVGEAREIRHYFLELPEAGLREILDSLAHFLHLCHDHGVYHRDLSDGNILVRRDAGVYRFYLLDTNRIRIRSKLGPLLRMKNLVRLGVPDRLQLFFLDEYHGGRLKKMHVFWYKTNKKCYSFYVELKKKLRLKQLARKLKIQ